METNILHGKQIAFTDEATGRHYYRKADGSLAEIKGRYGPSRPVGRPRKNDALFKAIETHSCGGVAFGGCQCYRKAARQKGTNSQYSVFYLVCFKKNGALSRMQ